MLGARLPLLLLLAADFGPKSIPCTGAISGHQVESRHEQIAVNERRAEPG